MKEKSYEDAITTNSYHFQLVQIFSLLPAKDPP